MSFESEPARWEEYLRCFWWPVALAEEVKDIPVPVKLLGEELVLFRDLSGELTLLGAYCSHRRASLEYGIIQATAFAAPITDGATTGTATSSTALPSRSKPRPTFSIPGIQCRNWAGLYSPIWERQRKPAAASEVRRAGSRRLSSSGTRRRRGGQSLQLQLAPGRGKHHGHHAPDLSSPNLRKVSRVQAGGKRIRRQIVYPGAAHEAQSCGIEKKMHRAADHQSQVARAQTEKSRRTFTSRSSRRSGSYPIDDTHCEEMRLTVYPEKPKERRYHGAFLDQAKERERKPYDRRFYGEIKRHRSSGGQGHGGKPGVDR